MVRKWTLLLTYLILVFCSFAYANAPGSYNSTVNVTVNVTNAPPVILAVGLINPISLTPGGITLVNCTINGFDWNGGADIVLANATFWDNLSTTVDAIDSNLSHYTNDNCTTTGTNGYYRNFTCGFNITYYANASTQWVCNATIKDNYTLKNYTDSKINTTQINTLYAINITPTLDFGDQVLGDYADNKTVNITNFGNQAMNISVDGYGATDGDGLSMKCVLQGNLSLDDLRYSADPNLVWATRTPLQDIQQNITGFIIPKINLIGVNPGDWYNTYWSLYINPTNTPFGFCNGTIVFTAWNS